MKVTDKRMGEPTTTFKVLKVGAGFAWRGDIYVKVDNLEAFSLTFNIKQNIYHDPAVTPVNLEVVVTS